MEEQAASTNTMGRFETEVLGRGGDPTGISHVNSRLGAMLLSITGTILLLGYIVVNLYYRTIDVCLRLLLVAVCRGAADKEGTIVVAWQNR